MAWKRNFTYIWSIGELETLVKLCVKWQTEVAGSCQKMALLDLFPECVSLLVLNFTVLFPSLWSYSIGTVLAAEDAHCHSKNLRLEAEQGAIPGCSPGVHTGLPHALRCFPAGPAHPGRSPAPAWTAAATGESFPEGDTRLDNWQWRVCLGDDLRLQPRLVLWFHTVLSVTLENSTSWSVPRKQTTHKRNEWRKRPGRVHRE